MNDDQRLIADTTERMLEAHCTNQLIDQAEKGVYPTKLWELLESNGLTSLGVDTSLGGGGGSFGDALVVLRQAGRFAVPLPLAETLVATQVLGECGIQVQKGAALVVGAEPGSSGDSLTWTARAAAFGRHCDTVYFFDEQSPEQLHRFSQAQITLTEGEDLAGCARDDLRVKAVDAEIEVIKAGSFDLARLKLFGAATRAVMMAGALEAALEATVGYALERKQFGKPIGKFQAIQQQLAVFSTQVAASTRAAETLMVSEELLEVDVAIAKARIGEAAGIGAEIAHQVFGAIGYTKEHGLNHLTRRLWVWRDEYGHEGFWQAHLGHLLLANSNASLWHQVTELG